MTTFPCHLSTLNSSSPSRERETSLVTSLRCENWPFIRTFDTCRSAGGCVPTCPLWQRFPDGTSRSLSSGDREIFCGIKDALTAFEEKPGDSWGSTSLSPRKPVPRVVLRLLVSVAWLDETQPLALPWGGPGRGAALNVKLKASPAKRAYVKTATNKKPGKPQFPGAELRLRWRTRDWGRWAGGRPQVDGGVWADDWLGVFV